MSAPTGPSWYDVLGVEPTAGTDEIRTAWRSQIADLDPGQRRFRLLNQAAEVLLDPDRRSAHDAELAAVMPEAAPESAPEPTPTPPQKPASEPTSKPVGEDPGSATPRGDVLRRPVPGWLLVLVGVLAVAAVTLASVTVLRGDPEDQVSAARSAAERAVVPVLSYDYRSLEEDAAAARSYMTRSFREENFDPFFEGLLDENIASREASVQAEVVESAVVRTGEERVDVLVFVDRATTNVDTPEPIVYRDQVTVTMVRSGGEWLVDALRADPIQA